MPFELPHFDGVEVAGKEEMFTLATNILSRS